MRVLITGASGSGTTTLGRALAAELKTPFFDADDYFWLPTQPPYQQKRDPSARLSLFVKDLATVPNSVTAGSVINWGGELEGSFSFVVFLVLQSELRLARLRKRESARFGRPDPEFLAWAAQYDKRSTDVYSRIGDERWIAERSCPVLRIEGDIAIPERVTRVTEALSKLRLHPAQPEVTAEVRR